VVTILRYKVASEELERVPEMNVLSLVLQQAFENSARGYLCEMERSKTS